MHQMKESEKESKEKSTSIEMESLLQSTRSTPDDVVIEMGSLPQSTGNISAPDDVVIEMPEAFGEFQSVLVPSLHQEIEAALETMEKKLDTLIQQNDRFHADPPKISDNKVKKKKGFKEKTAAFIKANDYTHFDLSVERRKLLTREVLQESLQKDLDSLKSEIRSNLPRYSSDSSKKLEKLNRDIEKLEEFLNSSDIALDLEVRKSNGKLTWKEYSKAVIQGKEHMRAVALRSFAQSLISAGSGTGAQILAASLKELAFNAMVSQLTERQANEVVEDFLDGPIQDRNPEIIATNSPEITTTSAQSIVSDEALVNVTNAIATSDPAKFSKDLCENLLDHLESLEELPDTVEELKAVAVSFLNGEIERLGNERSFSHNFIKTMQNCVDFSSEIKRINKPDSPYYDATELDYATIIGGDIAIAIVKGCILPLCDSLYEKGKDIREIEKITSQKKKMSKFKKFRRETSDSVSSQFKGTITVLGLIFLLKAASGKLTFAQAGKDITFNALALSTVGVIDGVRSLCSSGETTSQVTKATLRTIVGRGGPQVLKSLFSRSKEFGATGIAVTTDLTGVLLGGALKEINGALWQRSANRPDGWMNSWAGKAGVHEKALFKALKKRAGSGRTVPNFLEAVDKVNDYIAKSNTYLNQVDPTLTEVTTIPSVSQNLLSGYGAGSLNYSNPVTGATNVTAGATNVTAGATNVTAGATNVTAGAASGITGATNVTARATNVSLGAINPAFQHTTIQSLREQQQKLDTEIEKIQKSRKDPKITEEQKKSLKQQEKSLESRRTEIRQQRDILSPPTTSNTDNIVTTAEVHSIRKFDATKFKSSSITPNPNGARPKQGPKQGPKQSPKQSPKPGRK
jgi:hypothetical protein